jgi:hypothetical protein
MIMSWVMDLEKKQGLSIDARNWELMFGIYLPAHGTRHILA